MVTVDRRTWGDRVLTPVTGQGNTPGVQCHHNLYHLTAARPQGVHVPPTQHTWPWPLGCTHSATCCAAWETQQEEVLQETPTDWGHGHFLAGAEGSEQGGTKTQSRR